MRPNLKIIVAGLLMSSILAVSAQAQKGVGDPTGIARQGVQPEVVTLEGTVQEIKIGPCEMTTGKATSGTHVLLESTAGDQLNIHLGPTASVANVVSKLGVGQKIAVQAFHTDKLPQDQYVAQTVTVGGETIAVRDENLRPLWASGRVAQQDRGGSQEGFVSGKGNGRGRGAASGRGQGQARNMAYGQGRGQCGMAGLGPGRGGGQGQGLGQGKGRGQGRGFGQGQCCGQGQGLYCEQQLGAIIESLPKGELSQRERENLLFMREEEKLAHDVYVTLGKTWGLPPLANIPQAESRHMEFVKTLLDRYSLADPLPDQVVGKFPSQQMQALYDQLVAQGEESVEAAIKVGALIEERNIADLSRVLEEADHDDLKVVYQNLLKGSRNHLRTFARQLSRYNTTYEAKHLSQEEFDRFASSAHERGVVISDPNYAF